MIAINKKQIGEQYFPYIIAEMGINHNGRFDIALKMVEAAAACGADAVKLQIISADESYTRNSKSYDIFKKIEFSLEQWQKIVAFAKNKGIDVFSTFVNLHDLKYAALLDLPAIKISSTSITNFPLLEAAGRIGKPIIISTGMSYLSEVDEAVRCLERNGMDQIGIMHCTSLYPTAPEDVNLRVIETFKLAFPCYPVGYSDHTSGIHCAVAAVALGAQIIEKHFTLDKSMPGPDHHFSVTPDELKRMIREIREVKSAMGSSLKRPAKDEIPIRSQLQRSLVAAVRIRKGQEIKPNMLASKRSADTGIAPKYLSIVSGRTAKIDIEKDTPITWELI